MLNAEIEAINAPDLKMDLGTCEEKSSIKLHLTLFVPENVRNLEFKHIDRHKFSSNFLKFFLNCTNIFFIDLLLIIESGHAKLLKN